MPHNSRLSHCLPQEPVDGAPIVAAVLFQEAEGEPAATLVTLRISYLLPRAWACLAGWLDGQHA